MEKFVQQLIEKLGLEPLVGEGGLYTQTYRTPESLPAGVLPSRYRTAHPYSTAIYFLLTPEPTLTAPPSISCSPRIRILSQRCTACPRTRCTIFTSAIPWVCSCCIRMGAESRSPWGRIFSTGSRCSSLPRPTPGRDRACCRAGALLCWEPPWLLVTSRRILK
jgi:hypothetical protein